MLCVCLCVRVFGCMCFCFLDLTQLKECKWSFFHLFFRPLFKMFTSLYPSSIFPRSLWLGVFYPSYWLGSAPSNFPSVATYFQEENCELPQLFMNIVCRPGLWCFHFFRTTKSFLLYTRCSLHLLLLSALLGLTEETCTVDVWAVISACETKYVFLCIFHQPITHCDKLPTLRMHL